MDSVPPPAVSDGIDTLTVRCAIYFTDMGIISSHLFAESIDANVMGTLIRVSATIGFIENKRNTRSEVKTISE